ncbi:hypothetical protein PHYPSEUDO_004031 [Phytophthora pseudosyringae]|uniref:Elicitin n=1 Tax=Phytophthora pseudosyringae TaxID=221518 RepID=A0A8T1V1Y4_9STRA|nr:hypothetical protein PHYPSEUDO_004031 [Phytophthora pseudosyringae]
MMQFGIFFFFLLSAPGAVAEDACPPTEVVKFAELYANPHLHPCQNVSAGFSMAPPMGYPTEPQVKAMCASEACRALIKDVLALKPADCCLSFAGVELNAHKMASSFEDACKDGSDDDHEDDKHHPTPKPTDDKYHPTPKPTKDTEHYLTPKPTKYNKHYPTSKPTDDKHHWTPKPTDGKYYPTPKPTEDDKHYPTPKPTDGKYHSTPKPTNDKDTFKLEEPMTVTHCAGKESAKDADELKPPMNGTALELFPTPNTTYKATASPKA